MTGILKHETGKPYGNNVWPASIPVSAVNSIQNGEHNLAVSLFSCKYKNKKKKQVNRPVIEDRQPSFQRAKAAMPTAHIKK